MNYPLKFTVEPFNLERAAQWETEKVLRMYFWKILLAAADQSAVVHHRLLKYGRGRT